ncbi:MAG: threonylcarbamoyl-AMP synthase [Candidatus Helarchaeota archaeon]|nr:threonylcarbamoyl-AMP synthase [Candidatus Helarchaeota archaeon]
MIDKIIRLDPNKMDLKVLNKAAEFIKQGKLVVYPTDTVYGLGTDPMNITAVSNLLLVKRRDEKKGLPILASSLDAIKRIAKVNMQVEVLANTYWPGPLTIIIPKLESLPSIVTGGRRNVAVRIPQNKIALLLTHLSNGLMIGTSANISNQRSPTKAEEAFQQIGELVDLILDGGPSKLGVSSTVVDLTKRPPKVIRKGPIKISF